MTTSKLGSFSDLTLRKPDDAPKPAAAKRPAGKSRKKAHDWADASSPLYPALTDETVKMTVKLSRADWERISELRLSHRLPFQRVAIAGLNLFLKEMGQRPLQTSEGDEE